MAETPRVGIIANPSKEGAKELLLELIRKFESKAVEIVLEDESACFAGLENGARFDSIAEQVDLFVVLGGDGTILWVLRQLQERIKPIAAINTGTLGFLTCAREHESRELVEAISTGNFEQTDRVIIQGRFEMNGEVIEEFVGLNEVTLCRGVDSRVIHVEASIDGKFANRYTGDGLILATPTGSTAYSLSAGGPLIQPGSNVFAITPICPHTLANRPLVVSASSEVIFDAPEQRDDLSLLVDGQLVRSISDPARIIMGPADFSLPLISLPGQDFFGVLHRKMGWAGSTLG
ncbi:MAG: NAD(+)/NADH kinase [Verrucomicrobiota bacterium]